MLSTRLALFKRGIAAIPYSGASKNPIFLVGRENGFLPVNDPITKLPSNFSALESLLQRMPKQLPNGQPGLLWEGKFGDAVLKELPLYDVDNITDGALLMTLFRDYTFASSAYLLEPCDIEFRKSETYGIGRPVLPKQLAVPLAKVAKKIDAKPFMEYAQSYALYNYKKIDPSKGLDFDNMQLIRSFGGYPSERGFILVHVAMVAHTKYLVSGVLDAFEASAKGDRPAFDNALSSIVGTLRKINEVMETMWGRSLAEDYNSFRVLIMGTKNQPMFPKGVIYEGVSDQPTFYRGESGANDSIVPTMDNFLQLTKSMPDNPLTSILKDFRSYRPIHHNQWLQFVDQQSSALGIKNYALAHPSTAILYLQLLDNVRDFRARHWNFTKQYIIKNTTHPVATGGSPIVTWLPNQLSVVLEAMKAVKVDVSRLDPFEKQIYEEAVDRADAQARLLKRDVDMFTLKFGKTGTVAAAIN